MLYLLGCLVGAWILTKPKGTPSSGSAIDPSKLLGIGANKGIVPPQLQTQNGGVLVTNGTIIQPTGATGGDAATQGAAAAMAATQVSDPTAAAAAAGAAAALATSSARTSTTTGGTTVVSGGGFSNSGVVGAPKLAVSSGQTAPTQQRGMGLLSTSALTAQQRAKLLGL